jgi:S1-C subfamily serine protease
VAAEGSEVGSADDLFEALDRAGSGGTVQLGVIRGDEERTVAVSLTPERPAAEEA